MKKKMLKKWMIASVSMLLMIPILPAPAGAASTTFINPVAPYSSADPHVYKHTDGYYYYVHTSEGWDSIDIVRASSLTGIGNGERKTVFTESSAYCEGPNCYSNHIWAPEIYHFNGTWYLYFAAGSDEPDYANQRMWVITNTSANPLNGSWSAPIKISDSADYWAIDHTVANIDGQLYIAWSEIAPNQPQRIMIAKMSDPTTIVGRGTMISAPTNSWERQGGDVNEACFSNQRVQGTHDFFRKRLLDR